MVSDPSRQAAVSPRPPRPRRSEHTRWNRFARFVWGVVWLIMFRPSPSQLHGWRRFLLRLFGAQVGKGVRVYPSSKFWAPWRATLGDFCTVGPGTEVYCVAPITLEPYSNVAQHCYLCTASHDYRKLSKPLITLPITIGRHAWLAAFVFIGPGVTVGEGAVCGGQACVFKDVEPWTVVGGNPATFIKRRELDEGEVPW